MQSEYHYEIRVKVNTLADASKAIQILDMAGYKEVEMGPPRGHFPGEILAKMVKATRGRLNKMILSALCRLGAVDSEHAAEIDKVIEEMKNDLESANLAKGHPEGVLLRTVTMVTPAILAEKHGWVNYDKKQMPRKFWLTENGIEKLKSM